MSERSGFERTDVKYKEWSSAKMGRAVGLKAKHDGLEERVV
jgi:hypothetical protein